VRVRQIDGRPARREARQELLEPLGIDELQVAVVVAGVLKLRERRLDDDVADRRTGADVALVGENNFAPFRSRERLWA
jgi:hypothetical protein